MIVAVESAVALTQENSVRIPWYKIRNNRKLWVCVTVQLNILTCKRKESHDGRFANSDPTLHIKV